MLGGLFDGVESESRPVPAPVTAGAKREGQFLRIYQTVLSRGYCCIDCDALIPAATPILIEEWCKDGGIRHIFTCLDCRQQFVNRKNAGKV